MRLCRWLSWLYLQHSARPVLAPRSNQLWLSRPLLPRQVPLLWWLLWRPLCNHSEPVPVPTPRELWVWALLEGPMLLFARLHRIALHQTTAAIRGQLHQGWRWFVPRPRPQEHRLPILVWQSRQHVARVHVILQPRAPLYWNGAECGQEVMLHLWC